MSLITIQLIGQFEVRDENGAMRLPRGKKEVALLAMLACTPGNRLTRKFIRTTLWSDRSEAQAKTSLRTSLYRIRSSLGKYKNIIKANKTAVFLSNERNQIEIDKPCQIDSGVKIDKTKFLQGIECNDPAFIIWLKNYRNELAIAPRDLPQYESDSNKISPKVNFSFAGHITPACDSIAIGLRAPDLYYIDDSLLNDWLLDSIIAESYALRIVKFQDLRNLPLEDRKNVKDLARYHLFTSVRTVGSTSRVSAQLIETAIGTLIWDSTLHFTKGDNNTFRKATQRISNGLINYLLHWDKSPEKNTLTRNTAFCLKGILAPGSSKIEEIQHKIEWLLNQQPASIHYALSALLCALKIGECYSSRNSIEYEQLQHDMSRALELDSSNPVTLAMLGHIHGYVLGNLATGLELTKEAIDRQPMSPISTAFHAIAMHYAGDQSKSIKFANIALGNGSSSFVRPLLQSISSSAHLLSGDLDTAMRYAQEALGSTKNFRPALYVLFVSYTQLKQYEQAERILKKLKDGDTSMTPQHIESDESPVKNTELRGQLINALKQYN